MILGAGYNQLQAIKKASQLGYYVITVDYLPDNIGHKFSDHFIDVSTTDKEGVLGAAKALSIDGIITFASDVAVPTAAYVSEKLDFPGYDTDVAIKMSNKGDFRKVQHEYEIRQPNFIIGQELDKIKDGLSGFLSDLVFKPVDTSGSRGISFVKKNTSNKYEHPFLYAQEYSRSSTVCVEEFIEGIDISGDGFIVDGKLVFAFFTQKFTNNFLVTGHFLPLNLEESERKLIIKEIETNCAAVGYKNGPINFDVLLTFGEPVVIEMSPRLGGNGIPALIEHNIGIDLTTMSLKFAMGDLSSIPTCNVLEKSCGSLIFGSNHQGVIKNISSSEKVCETIPEIFKCIIKYQPGDKIEKFIHGGNSIVHVLFDCSTPAHYSEVVNRFFETINLKVLI